MLHTTASRERGLLLGSPTWCVGAWSVLLLLVMWGYGANNIAIPGVPIPFVDIALVALFVRSRRWWYPFIAAGIGRTMLIALVALSMVVAIRLAVDVPRHGLEAARGALFAVEVWAVFVGAAVARRLGRDRVVSLLTLLFAVALAWYCLYPFRATIVAWSPSVGVRRSTNLFSFTRMGLIGAWALLWFGLRRSLLAPIGVGASIVIVILAQSRGTIAGVVASITVVVVAASHRRARRARSRLLTRVVIGLAIGITLLTVAPTTTGRLGTVSVDTYIDLARSAIGQDTSVASSFDDRVEWFDATVQSIRDTRLGWLAGVGFGTDLTGGFGVAGTDVVNPHNDLLEFYARLGVFVLPWLAMWAVSFREFWRRARSGDRLALWALGAWMSMVAGSLTQPFNSFAYGGMVWWMFTGLVLGHPAVEQVDEQTAAGSTPSRSTRQPSRRRASTSA